MRNEKLNSAEKLLDAIGDIDLRFIAEAEAVPEIKKKRFVLPRKTVNVLAGALAFVFVIFGVSVALLGGRVDADMAPEEDKSAMNDILRDPAEKAESVTLGDVILSVQSNTKIKQLSAEEIEFFDDTIRIIWCYEGDENYRVVEVPASKNSELLLGIERLKNAPKTKNTGEMPCAIWICLEDGRVITPYLEWSDGNVGYAELFEYSPEIEPSSAFTELINEIIS